MPNPAPNPDEPAVDEPAEPTAYTSAPSEVHPQDDGDD